MVAMATSSAGWGAKPDMVFGLRRESGETGRAGEGMINTFRYFPRWYLIARHPHTAVRARSVTRPGVTSVPRTIVTLTNIT